MVINLNENSDESDGDFSNHPLAPLFFEYIKILESHNFHKEAEDLLEVSKNFNEPDNKRIITNVIIEMQKVAVSDEADRFRLMIEKMNSTTNVD